MTPDQLRLYDYIRERIEDTGIAPTYEEMGRYVRRGRAAVKFMVDRIVRQGMLLREPGRARGLSLPNQPSVLGITTERLEAELRRRGRQPAWSREFLAGFADPHRPMSIRSPRRG